MQRKSLKYNDLVPLVVGRHIYLYKLDGTEELVFNIVIKHENIIYNSRLMPQGQVRDIFTEEGRGNSNFSDGFL